MDDCDQDLIVSILPNQALWQKGSVRLISSSIPGIIDVYYQDSSGDWKLLNNLVSMIRFIAPDGTEQWNNTEIQQASIQAFETLETGETKIVYNPFEQFDPIQGYIPSQIQLSLTLIPLTDKQGFSAQFEILKNPQNLPITGITLAPFYGLQHYITSLTSISDNSKAFEVSTPLTQDSAASGLDDFTLIPDQPQGLLLQPSDNSPQLGLDIVHHSYFYSDQWLVEQRNHPFATDPNSVQYQIWNQFSQDYGNTWIESVQPITNDLSAEFNYWLEKPLKHFPETL